LLLRESVSTRGKTQLPLRNCKSGLTGRRTGFGLSKYKELQAEQQQRDFEDADRRRAEAMMDAYGDRSSLEALQAAVREYDTQKKG
jgi:hypothetical protein